MDERNQQSNKMKLIDKKDKITLANLFKTVCLILYTMIYLNSENLSIFVRNFMWCFVAIHSCKEYRNLNSFFAIVMGLSNIAVSRLSQTWEVSI